MVINYKNYIWLAIIVVVIELLRFGAIAALGFVDDWSVWRRLGLIIIMAIMFFVPAAVALYFYQRATKKAQEILLNQERERRAR
jgi:hypothetical protein